MSFFGEFKKFAMRGNVMDMAVGIILGGAFGKIVSSLVADIIMPPVGLLIGGVNFTDLVWTIKKATDTAPAVDIHYGNFIQMILDFLIVAFAIFLFIKGINKLSQTGENLISMTKGKGKNQKEETPTPEPTPAPTPTPAPSTQTTETSADTSKQEALLTEIRDLLAKK